MAIRKFSLIMGSVLWLGCGSDAKTKSKDAADLSGGEGGSPGSVGTGGRPGAGGNVVAGSGGAVGSGGMTGSGGSGRGGAGGGSGGMVGSGGAPGQGGAVGAGGARMDAGQTDVPRGGDARPTDAVVAAGKADPKMSFFLTSTGSGAMGGNLGGLEAADKKCKELATAVGVGEKEWVAWLSVDKGPGGTPVHAKDRVGKGPWHDSKGRLIAETLADLLPGPKMKSKGLMAAVNDLIDEKGAPVSKQPNQHDILTGTKSDGMVAPNLTCGDWKSNAATDKAMLGHSDTAGPPDRLSWTEGHESNNCTQAGLVMTGGNGRFYCLSVTK